MPSLIRNYFNFERLVHSLKTGLACIIGFFFLKFFPIPSSQWVLITILVVMCAQLSVGGMLQKSYMRFIGTLFGSILAILAVYLFDNNSVVAMIVVTGAAILFSYIATGNSRYNDAGTLGAVTVVIILLSQNSTVTTGFTRFIEISVGIIIATVVSQFVFPFHASLHLQRSQAETLRELQKYYRTFFLEVSSENLIENEFELDETIVKSLSTQRKLANEAKRELFSEKFSIDYFKQSLWCEKEILRSIFLMYFAYNASETNKRILLSMPLLQEFHVSICKALEDLASSIEKKSTSAISLPALAPLKVAFQPLIENAIFQDRIYIDSYLFCIEILEARMEKLVNLIAQF